MVDPDERKDATRRPPSPLLQASTAPIGGAPHGITGIVGRDATLINQAEPSIENSTHRINANDAVAKQLKEFDKWTKRGDQGDQLAILYLVRLDRAASLITALTKRDGLPGTRALLEQLDEQRMVELLGPDGLQPQLSTGILAMLSLERARRLLKLLGTDNPERAARLVERLASLSPFPDTRAGLRGAIEVFPRDGSGPRVLAELSDDPVTVSLLENLSRDLLCSLLIELEPTALCRRLRQAPAAVLAALPVDHAGLPVDELAHELGQLSPDWLASELRARSPVPFAPWIGRMPPDRAAAVLGHMSMSAAALVLKEMDNGRAVLIMKEMEPDTAAARLGQMHSAAAELLIGLASVDRAWLGDVLSRMPRRLVVALLVWIDMKDPDAAKQLRAAIPGEWRFGITGWPSIDAGLMLWTIAGSVAHHVTNRARGTGPPGAAPHQAVRDILSLWQSLRRAASPPDYRRQRNILAIALPLVLVVGVVVGSSPSPASAPSSLPAPNASVDLGTIERAGLQAVSSYRADWPERDCPSWKQDVSRMLDANKPTPTNGPLSLSCQLKTATGVELALVWYPPTEPPGGDRFSGRPTFGAYRVITPGDSSSQWPRWSTASPGDTRNGTYLKYFPDEGRAAIWLEDERNSVALMLFGPPGGGDVFTQLQAILAEHGYRLR